VVAAGADSIATAETVGTEEVEAEASVELDMLAGTAELEIAEFVSIAAAAASILVTVAVAVVRSVTIVVTTALLIAEVDVFGTSPATLWSPAADCGDISGVAGVKTRVTFCAPFGEVELDGGAGAGAVEFSTTSKADVILATLALEGVSGS
jgi:hypothetical protein